MRYAIPVLVLVLLAGCGGRAPLQSHSHPVAHWVKALREPDVRVRKKAVQALGHAAGVDAEALTALIGALKDRDAAVRAQAVLALLNLGPAAREAVPALEEAQKDRDARVRAYSGKALDKIRGS
jgi:HEAT repeat protein